MAKAAMSRRQFVSAAGLGAGALAAFGLVGCAPGSAESGAAPATEGATATADWLGIAPEIADSEITATEETELLIVGAGNGGMVAAATAADLGMQFVVCEKSGTVQSARHWVGGVGTKWQKEAGIESDKGKILNELTRYASGRCTQDVWKVWIDESAETIEYLDGIMQAGGLGIYLDLEGYDHKTGGTDFYVPMQQHMWFDPAVAEAAPPSLWGETTAHHRNIVLEEYIGAKGFSVSYGHELVKLIREEGGRVTGAIFKTEAGYTQINASKGVLLTTGGYAANPVMVNALAKTIPECCTAAYYSPNCTGDGIRAGLWVGARMDSAEAPMIFDRGAVPAGVDSGYIGEGAEAMFPSPAPQIVQGSLPFLKVNREGKRFFNESAPYDWSTAAASNQPGGVWASIWDANCAADAARFSVVGCAKIGSDLLQMGPTEAVLAELVEGGILIKADTLEELADGLGLPKETFLAEVERYNELYDKQVDEDYGKEAFRLSALRTAPFYGLWFGGSLLTTLDGLKINADMQVLDESCQVIEGLYAAGDCSGSLFSGNYPEYLVGCAVGRTMTEARHAVRYISENA